MKRSHHFFGLIAALVAVIALAMPASATSFYSLDQAIGVSPLDDIVITLKSLDDVAVLPAVPKCRKCGSKFIDAHAGEFIRSNQPGAAWRIAADIAPPPLARSLN